MSPGLAQALHRSGWTPTRSVDVYLEVSALREDGYTVIPAAAEDFLRQFGGLTLCFMRDGTPDTVKLGTRIVLGQLCAERVQEEYAARTGTALIPIGVAFSEHMSLLLDERGRMFGGYDDLLLHLGDTPVLGLEEIVSGRRGRPIA